MTFFVWLTTDFIANYFTAPSSQRRARKGHNVPAKAEIQAAFTRNWIPAFAGTTTNNPVSVTQS